MREQVAVINQKNNDAKKEVERLESRRSEALGNSINYVENELKIERVKGQIEAYEIAIELIERDQDFNKR